MEVPRKLLRGLICVLAAACLRVEAAKFSYSAKINRDDSRHEKLLHAIAQIGALIYERFDDDRSDMFNFYDTHDRGYLDEDEVQRLLEDARVGHDAARLLWAKNLIHAMDISEPYDKSISLLELYSVFEEVGYDDTGAPCYEDANGQQGFCPSIPFAYDYSTDCDCLDAEWPKIRAASVSVDTLVDESGSCHDLNAWQRCANQEARDLRIAGTTNIPPSDPKHPCQVCDAKLLCSVSRALIHFNGPAFEGSVIADPAIVDDLAALDTAAQECGVQLRVLQTTSRKLGLHVHFTIIINSAFGEHQRSCNSNCIGGIWNGRSGNFPDEAKCFVNKIKVIPTIYRPTSYSGLEFRTQSSREESERVALAVANHQYTCAIPVFKVGSGTTIVGDSETDGLDGIAEGCVSVGAASNSFSQFAWYNSVALMPEVTDEGGKCEYTNPFLNDNAEPRGYLVDACQDNTCCDSPCGHVGVPATKLSRHFKAYEFMSRQPAKDTKFTATIATETGSQRTLNRFFRLQGKLLSCLDLVNDKSMEFLFPEDQSNAATRGAIKIIHGFWTRSQAERHGEYPSRHQAGTAVRFTYADSLTKGINSAKVVQLAGFVISECTQLVDNTGFSMGIKLYPDGVYIDLRKRDRRGTMVSLGAADGSVVDSESFQNWVDEGRYIQNEVCANRWGTEIKFSPPRRQNPLYTYQITSSTGSRHRRGVLDYVFGDSEFCKTTQDARMQEMNELWARLLPAIQAQSGGRARDDIYKALRQCFLACSGGLLDRGSDEEEEKKQACSELVHWLPIGFGGSQDSRGKIEQCHIYPYKNQDLKKSACFWGNCIDETDLHAALWPSFSKGVAVTHAGCFYRLSGSQDRIRGTDACGSGAWQASRGSRTHNGIDIVTIPGQNIQAPFACRVVRQKNPYTETKGGVLYTGVEIQGTGDWSEYRATIFYITLKSGIIGTTLNAGAVLGTAQNTDPICSSMTNHIHLEITKSGSTVNPAPYLCNGEQGTTTEEQSILSQGMQMAESLFEDGQYDEPETLFDDILNPTPMHSILQETFAMHCAGKVTVWVQSEEEIRGLQPTLLALFGYNRDVSAIEMQIPITYAPDGGGNYYWVIDSLEHMLDMWQNTLCRSHSREFLAPYTVETDYDRFNTRKSGAASPAIQRVSVIFKPKSSGTSVDDQLDSASAVLIETVKSVYVLQFTSSGGSTLTVQSRVLVKPTELKFIDDEAKTYGAWPGEYFKIEFEGETFYKSRGRPVLGWTVEQARASMVESMSLVENEKTTVDFEPHVAQTTLRRTMGIFHHTFND
eukprot:m.25565 g.25565  ORF g.25565 m.25565 type:complete len:1294 (-) comp7717_c0_seq1:1991-5872(-)